MPGGAEDRAGREARWGVEASASVETGNYNRAVTLYTRTGDTGQTSLFGGGRVAKSEARVDAYGEVDELNAWLGSARAGIDDPQVAEWLGLIQRDLFALGAHLADSRSGAADRDEKTALGAEDVRRLEGWIDAADAEVAPLRSFILPGGSRAGGMLHVARTVCRRAERRIVSLGAEAVDPLHLTYINRLSDLLFALARLMNHRANAIEDSW